MDTEALKVWRGEFGDAYTDRNMIEPASRRGAFAAMTEGLTLASVLEVGCNRGHNLVVLRDLYPGAEVCGVEPNAHARAIANESLGGVRILDGCASSLPFADGSQDLVLTCGVLIHVHPDDVKGALEEICRVSRRWLLVVEYFAADEQEILYRGRRGLLWKRDYLTYCQAVDARLRLVRNGFWGPADGFDRVHWWLLER